MFDLRETIVNMLLAPKTVCDSCMMARITYYISKLIRRSRPPALRHCKISPKAVVLSGSDLTNVIVGRFSYCGYNCQIVECEIGAFCSIADGVAIGRGEHPITAVSTSPVFHAGKNIFRRNFATHNFERGGRTTIGNDVWIGLGSIIKAGVTIGDGAVVGAGSVVTKDVAPYSICAGVPAREIRKRFDDETCKALQESRWWDWPEEQIEREAPKFAAPDTFLS